MASLNPKVGKAVLTGFGVEKELNLTEMGSLVTCTREGINAEAARQGRRFCGGNSIIANGIAPVSAIPTTTATLALVNTNSDGGRSLYIDQIGFWLGSGTAAAGATLFAAVSGLKIADASLPTAQPTGYKVGSTSGYGASMAYWATALTVNSLTTWFQVTSTFQLAAANVGQGFAPTVLGGGLVIPPKYALCFGILSGAGTSPLYGISCTWNEFEHTIEAS